MRKIFVVMGLFLGLLSGSPSPNESVLSSPLQAATATSWSTQLANLKARIYADYPRVVSWVVTSSTPANGGRAYVTFVQDALARSGSRTYVVRRTYQIVVTGSSSSPLPSYYVRLLSTIVM